MSEWGNPAPVMGCHSGLNEIGPGEGTRGIETSQYPEERKATATPLVAASEKGRGETVPVSKPSGVAGAGLWELTDGALDPSRSYQAAA